jgi:hypothetical protein
MFLSMPRFYSHKNHILSQAIGELSSLGINDRLIGAKMCKFEETRPIVLRSIGMGKARLYRPPVPHGTAFVWSSEATSAKASICFETLAVTRQAVVLTLSETHPMKIHRFTTPLFIIFIA